MRLISLSLLLLTLTLQGAVITIDSLEPTQFDTNSVLVKSITVHTNDVGIIRPALVSYLSTMTNFNEYGTFSLPSKVTLLSLGTNYLDLTQQSSWLLNSPTNDATQVILSLSAGAYQGQEIELVSQNDSGGFTLPNLSEQYDVPGGLVIIGSDWIGTTNRGLHLKYSSPDIILFGIPTDPSQPGGGGGGGSNVLWNVTNGNLFPQPAVDVVSITSQSANNATNVAQIVDTASLWTETSNGAALERFKNNHNQVSFITPEGGYIRGRSSSAIGLFSIGSDALISVNSTENGDPPSWNFRVGSLSEISSGSGGWFTAQGSTNSSTIQAIVGDPANNNGLTFIGSDTDGALDMTYGGTVVMLFNPTVASTGSSVAYLLNNSNTLTNGDSLALIRHVGTNRFDFHPDGSSIFISDGQTSFGAYNTASQLSLTNSLDADAVNTQRYPIALAQTGHMWNTSSNVSHSVTFMQNVIPVGGATSSAQNSSMSWNAWTVQGGTVTQTAPFSFTASGNGIFAGNIRTADPTSGSGNWRLGKKLSGSVLTLTTNYYEVAVDGVVGAIPIVTVTP